MAPEQAARREPAIGPAADVYALGAILYELLTGRPPFQGATAAGHAACRCCTQEPVPPPPAAARRLPRDLETICLKCLQKEPRRALRQRGRTWPTTCAASWPASRSRPGRSASARARLAVVPAQPAAAGWSLARGPGRRPGLPASPGSALELPRGPRPHGLAEADGRAARRPSSEERAELASLYYEPASPWPSGSGRSNLPRRPAAEHLLDRVPRRRSGAAGPPRVGVALPQAASATPTCRPSGPPHAGVRPWPSAPTARTSPRPRATGLRNDPDPPGDWSADAVRPPARPPARPHRARQRPRLRPAPAASPRSARTGPCGSGMWLPEPAGAAVTVEHHRHWGAAPAFSPDGSGCAAPSAGRTGSSCWTPRPAHRADRLRRPRAGRRRGLQPRRHAARPERDGPPGLLIVWDVAGRRELYRRPRGPRLAFSPDGRVSAVGSDRDVLLLDAAKGDEVADPARPRGVVYGWPGRRRPVPRRAGADQTARVGRADRPGDRLSAGTRAAISRVAFHPGGRRLVTGDAPASSRRGTRAATSGCSNSRPRSTTREWPSPPTAGRSGAVGDLGFRAGTWKPVGRPSAGRAESGRGEWPLRHCPQRRRPPVAGPDPADPTTVRVWDVESRPDAVATLPGTAPVCGAWPSARTAGGWRPRPGRRRASRRAT